MKIKVINYGYNHLPTRAHYNDAGMDVYAKVETFLRPGESKRIPLGLGVKLPDGYVAFVCPRSGLSSRGISCELAPIDSGYTGEIHAIVTNHTPACYKVEAGDRVGQLVVMPCILCDFITEDETLEERGNSGFGSTGN